MIETSFEKLLSASDLGLTGGHMGGILIPRNQPALIALFPSLNPLQYNPSVDLDFTTSAGLSHKLRLVYYNNKLHNKGTRNEYRLTCLTRFLRNSGADIGDRFRITKTQFGAFYMEVSKTHEKELCPVIKLAGWNRVC